MVYIKIYNLYLVFYLYILFASISSLFLLAQCLLSRTTPFCTKKNDTPHKNKYICIINNYISSYFFEYLKKNLHLLPTNIIYGIVFVKRL